MSAGDHELLQKRGRGRPRKLTGAERDVVVRLTPETITAIDAACRPRESREDVIRTAIAAELKRRTRRQK